MTLAPRVISWDLREQPDLDLLAREVYQQSGGRVHITEVETGDDQYAIVVAGWPLDAREAFDLYRNQDEQGRWIRTVTEGIPAKAEEMTAGPGPGGEPAGNISTKSDGWPYE